MDDFGKLFELYLKVLITAVVVITTILTLGAVAIAYGAFQYFGN